MNIKQIKGYKLFDDWKLYESNNPYTWYSWIKYKLGITTYKNVDNYLFNCTNGELYKNEVVGKFAQETEHPYIYMNDCSYLRVLPEYEHIIKDSFIAKESHEKYIKNKLNDV